MFRALIWVHQRICRPHQKIGWSMFVPNLKLFKRGNQWMLYERIIPDTGHIQIHVNEPYNLPGCFTLILLCHGRCWCPWCQSFGIRDKVPFNRRHWIDYVAEMIDHRTMPGAKPHQWKSLRTDRQRRPTQRRSIKYRLELSWQCLLRWNLQTRAVCRYGIEIPNNSGRLNGYPSKAGRI